MKTATLLLLATTVVFAGTSVYLAIELGEARDALAAEVAANSTRALQAPSPAPAESPDADADAQGADLPEAPIARGSLPAPTEARPSGNRPFAGRNDERTSVDFNSAAAQRQRRLSQETRLRQQFADMPGELGLDKSQADKLFDLLADAQVANANSRRAYADDPLGARALADAARRDRDAQINALLGPDKAAEFLSFEKTIGARMQVGRIDADMTAADIPLRDDQRTLLISAIAAEQAANPAPQRDAGGNDQDYQSAYLAWQADYSKRVQAAVEPLLSSEQRARYREATELQNARRAQQRERAEQRRNSSQQQP
jgi:hypothetical protein